MTIRNTLLTLAKSQKFNRDVFYEKMCAISGLSEKQWKDTCGALLAQINRVLKGRNILIGRYISQYEKMLDDKKQKISLTQEQKVFYKKELEKLKKSQKNAQVDFSENDAVELLISEGYVVKKNDKGIETSTLLNVLRDRYLKMGTEDKKKVEEQLKAFFLSDK